MPPVQSNISRSLERNVLWPPVADAVDTFVRRKAGGGDAYELTWRLIHVWESIALVLTSAASARSRDLPALTGEYLRSREQFHGRSWNRISRSLQTFHSGFDGSAQARLNVLSEFARCDPGESAFLQALKDFVMAPRINIEPMVSAWARACDVPRELMSAGTVPVRDAMRHVNGLRNRFAHVPFPYDTLHGVADALENLTEQAFSIEPTPWKPIKDDAGMRCSPLVGAIAYGAWYLQGSASPHRGVGVAAEGCHFQFPGARVSRHVESWLGEPFVALDTMSRPYVLTRARGEPASEWEFTRFRSEANSILLRNEPEWVSLFPPPAQAEYEALDGGTTSSPVAERSTSSTRAPRRRVVDIADDLEDALRLIRNQEYAPAIRYFERELLDDPSQLTSWLRLGYAQREHAMRTRTKDPQLAHQLFSASIRSLTEAATHEDSPQRAEALFERSKAFHRLGRFAASQGNAEAARADAREAHRLAPGVEYESWLAFLERVDAGEPLQGE